MQSLILRVLVNAFLFVFLLPVVSGITFHGAFWPEGIVAGVLFGIVVYLVNVGLALFTIGTLGIGALAYFVFPALCIEAMAWLFPQYLSVSSFGAAFLAGILFWIGNAVLHSFLARAGSN
jgi:uncharacterized membrane protein YvlD (DUF360 family)